MEESSRQILNRIMLEIIAIAIMNLIILTEIYRTFHPNTKEYTFYFALHRRFSEVDHILRQKASLIRYKKIEIISYFLSDHHGLNLEKKIKLVYLWILMNSLLSEK